MGRIGVWSVWAIFFRFDLKLVEKIRLTEGMAVPKKF